MKVVKVSLYNVSFYLSLFLFLKTKKYLLFLLRCISFYVFLQCYFFLFVSCFRKANIKQKKTK